MQISSQPSGIKAHSLLSTLTRGRQDYLEKSNANRHFLAETTQYAPLEPLDIPFIGTFYWHIPLQTGTSRFISMLSEMLLMFLGDRPGRAPGLIGDVETVCMFELADSYLLRNLACSLDS
jgi:hypothetical protein